MPMDIAQIALELDTVEAHGAGRVSQEMAKSRHFGDNAMSPYPDVINAGLLAAKKAKTLRWVKAEIT